MNKSELMRFLEEHEKWQTRATKEVSDGKKVTNWMWVIFPQIQGFAEGPKAVVYGLFDTTEARAYLTHPMFGPALVDISQKLLGVEGRSALQIFGALDARKLHSCMTLFNLVAEGEPVFGAVLDKYFDGKPCAKTLTLADTTLGKATEE